MSVVTAVMLWYLQVQSGKSPTTGGVLPISLVIGFLCGFFMMLRAKHNRKALGLTPWEDF